MFMKVKPVPYKFPADSCIEGKNAKRLSSNQRNRVSNNNRRNICKSTQQEKSFPYIERSTKGRKENLFLPENAEKSSE